MAFELWLGFVPASAISYFNFADEKYLKVEFLNKAKAKKPNYGGGEQAQWFLATQYWTILG